MTKEEALNQQLLNAYDQINLTISDLEVYRVSRSSVTAAEAIETARELECFIEELMQLEGRKI